MSYHSISEPCVFVNPSRKRKRAGSARKYEGVAHRIEKLAEDVTQILNNENGQAVGNIVSFLVSERNVNPRKIPFGIILAGGDVNNMDNLYKNIEGNLGIDDAYFMVQVEARECNNLRTAIRRIVQAVIKLGESVPSLSIYQKYDARLLGIWHDLQRQAVGKRIKLVLVIRNFESMPASVINDMIPILSSFDELDIRIICDTVTSLVYVEDLLDTETIRALLIKVFETVPDDAVLDKVITKLLIDQPDGLRLSFEVYACLSNLFVRTRSVDGFVSAFKYAILCHNWHNDLAAIAYDPQPELFLLDAKSCISLRKRRSYRAWVEQILSDGDADEVESALLSLKEDKHLRNVFRFMMEDIKDYKAVLSDALHVLYTIKQHISSSSVKDRSDAEIYRMLLKQGLLDSNLLKDIMMSVKLLRPETLSSILQQCRDSIQSTELCESIDDYLAELREITELSDDPLVQTEPLAVRKLAVSFKKTIGTPKHRALRSEYDQRQDFAARQSTTARKTAAAATKSNMSQKEIRYTALIDSFHTLVEHIFSDLYNHEHLPFHELFWFDADNPIRATHMPNIRASLRTALTSHERYLGQGALEPATSSCFRLFQDSGQLINIYDWYTAFSPSSESDLPLFMRALNEMKFMGFIKSTARKTDHVSKVITIL